MCTNFNMKIPVLLLLNFLLSSCFSQSEQNIQQYYTWDGLEPDRWSSIWLLKRHLDPTAKVSIVPVGAQINKAIAIATPESAVKRTHGFSNFENLVKANNKINNVGLIRIGKIINELEISPWQSSTPAVAVVERQFRELQFKYNRTDVPYVCYAGFFDALYAIVDAEEISDSDEYLYKLSQALASTKVCQISTNTIASKNDLPVLEYSISYVMKLIAADKKVVFVDTREDEEFDEHHIPGSMNLKLREVNEVSAKQFEGADLVISYCVKDFRGYEVALALSKVGVKNVGIIKPYGLKGWKDLDLPVAGVEMSDEVALQLLKKRAASGV